MLAKELLDFYLALKKGEAARPLLPSIFIKSLSRLSVRLPVPKLPRISGASI